MSTTIMSSGNESSILPTVQDFHCCCSITREEFDATETAGVLIFNSIVLILTSISATFGNLLVLASIWRTPSLHSPSIVLLSGLALSDLGVGLIAQPLQFIKTIAELKGSVRVFCDTAVSLRLSGVLLLSASIFTVTAISLDMYLALYLHLRYQEIVTVKRMTGVLVGIWISSIAASLCNMWYQEHLMTLWTSFIVLCLVATTSAYCKVYRIVRHHQGQILAQNQLQEQVGDEYPLSFAQQKKSSMTKFLIYCLLVVCYLPFVVLSAVKTKDDTVASESLYEMSFMLVYFNSTLNPFIYCWRFLKIRAAVIETTKKIFRREISSQP